jgi:hypothetical protein
MTSTSITPPAAETTALSKWEALASDIAIASEQAEHKVFNYRDKWDNKAARSWIAELRRLKGGIERARKDAKAIHLERGRAVDETAKTLEASVQGLIEPHERELKAIEAEEQARIDAHKSVLDSIAALPEGVATAADAEARLAQLAEIDTAGLEEFANAGAARHAEATERLLELRDALREREAEQAELEALRAEKAAREEAERQERIRQEAIEQERARAAAHEQKVRIGREAEERRRAAEEQARREREAAAAAAREAQALAAAEAARRAQADAEHRAAEAERREQARLDAERQAEADRMAREHAAQQARKSREAKLRRELIKAMASSTPDAVADAIIAGSLHKALSIDWAAV